ncbi:lipopolysaccharide biosynthesis protein [Stenotrophomonas maltophilia]|uniref:lipopolysaccharide biosynthesis protein n=1 Tax=Stenotrophomonas maltophilia TaxID=40324 RepID=UPI0013118788|nr:Lipopolysaccharide biosynthesis protein WzxC [Stenotrophomonas maltophilia]
MTGLAAGAAWIAASQFVRVAAQVVGIFVLARLMGPTEYGLVALVSVVSAFAILFKDLGSSAAIIQSETLDPSMTNTAFWLNIGFGLILMLAICILAPKVGGAFGVTTLVPALGGLSLAFPVLSASAVHQALLERSQRFDIVAKIEMLAAGVGIGVAVVSAALGAGVYSVVLQTVVGAVVSSGMLWKATTWRPASPRQWSWYQFGRMLSFSRGLIGFNFVNYFSRNADIVIVGRMLPTAVLGAYSLSYRIMLFPLQSLTVVVSRSLFPAMSRLQGDLIGMRAAYFGSVRVVSFIVAPLMMGIFLLREPFVRLAFGAEWKLASDILAWLAPTGFLQAILSTTGVVFMATGRTGVLFKLGLVGAILQVGAFLVGVRYGILVMAACYLAANILNSVPVMGACMSALKAKPKQLLDAIWRPLLGAFIMTCSITFIWGERLQSGGMDWVEMLLVVIAGVCVYSAVACAIDRDFVSSILGSIRAKARSRKELN